MKTNHLIFTLLIATLFSCSNNDVYMYQTKNNEVFNMFTPIWDRYVESANGGWQNNDNGRFCWDDTYALDGLSYLYRLTKDTRYLDYCFEITDNIILNTDIHRNIQDGWRGGETLPAWSSTRYTFNNHPHVFTGHTCFIVYELVKIYTSIVDFPPCQNVEGYNLKATELLNKAQEAFASIEGDFKKTSTEAGYFRDPYFESQSIEEPLNLFCLGGLAALELHKATENTKYLKFAQHTAKYLRNSLVIKNDTLLWPYNAMPPYTPQPSDAAWFYPPEWDILRPDNQSHACLVALFIVECHDNNVEFSQDTIKKLVNTFTKNINRGNNHFSRFIDGLTDQLEDPSAFWFCLAPHSPEVFEILTNYSNGRAIENDPDSFLNHYGSVLIQYFAYQQN